MSTGDDDLFWEPPLGDPGRNTVGKYQRPGDAAETQRLAAFEALPQTGTQRRRVLNAISRAGDDGRTDEELQRELEMNPSTQRPRRVELVEQGWIEDSGHRRSTRSGRSAVVWILTHRGAGVRELRDPLLPTLSGKTSR